MQNSDSRQELIDQISQTIINAVNLHHINIKEVNANTPLMEGVLNLDSVDVLEAVVAIEHKFNIKVESAEEGKKYFQTIGTIAEFITEKKQN